MNGGLSVVVDREPFGSSIFSHCEAEFETDGTVIIRALGFDHREVQRFACGTWRSITAFGAGDVELFRVQPDTLAALINRLPKSESSQK